MPETANGARGEHPLTLYRRRHKLTLAALAARVPTSKATLSRIETGDRELSVPLLRQIVAATGGEVSADDIINAHANCPATPGRAARR